MNFADFVQQVCPGGAPPLQFPYGLTLSDLEAEYGHDPDWQRIKDHPNWLHHLSEMIHFRRLRQRGEVPPTYTAARECQGCGPVWLEPWTPEKVAGCPWCLNSSKGFPIPRP